MIGDIANYTKYDCLELAKLLKIIRQCDKLEIKGTIKYPQSNADTITEIAKTTISHNLTTSLLKHIISTWIEVQKGWEYSYKLGWDEKKPVRELCSDNNAIAPEQRIVKTGIFKLYEEYTKEELEQIIKYEQSKGTDQLTDNQKLGRRLALLYDSFIQHNIFQEGCRGKVIQYAFLYDYFVINKLLNEDVRGNSDKHNIVKDLIRSFRASPKNKNKLGK